MSRVEVFLSSLLNTYVATDVELYNGDRCKGEFLDGQLQLGRKLREVMEGRRYC